MQKKINNQNKFTMKKNSEINNVIINVYLIMSSKLKMSEYYNIKKFDIKYSKSYFTKLQNQKKNDKKNYIIFLDVNQKEFMTETERMMLKKYCIIDFIDSDIENK